MVINGRKIAEEVLEELKKKILDKKLKLRLVAVLVGEDPEFKKFVELKGKVAESIGVAFKVYQFSNDISNSNLVKEVKNISEQSDGTLIELPLPEHIDQQEVLNQIPVEKDVDVLSDKAQDKFYGVRPREFFEVEPQVFPPAVEALKIVLETYNIKLNGKKAAVFGQGILVGKPISHWLERQGSEVHRIRSTTENPGQYSRPADIIVTGVGKPGLVDGNMVKDGVIIVDFGYGKNFDGRMLGDVDFDSVASKASLITPVPGGMGPILITAVLKNLVKLKIKNGKVKI